MKYRILPLSYIGKYCKNYRQKNTGALQTNVAIDTGYSLENISAFERGLNDNMRIFLWYLTNGLDIQEMLKGEFDNEL